MKFGKWDLDSNVMAIIAFICIILSLLIITFTPPAAYYEISIYNGYSWYFWFFILTSIFLGQLIILKDVYYKTSQKKYKDWLLGIIIILIPMVIFLFLPIIRGYPTYGFGDHLTHIGEVKDILQDGHIAKNNFYPNLHILTAGLTWMTGTNIISIANFLSRFFFFFSPISIYLLYLIIFKNKDEMKFALILASTFLFFGSFCKYIAPYNQSLLLVPIILFLYLKRGNVQNNLNFSILFVIIIISYTFYHPLNILFLILIFLFFTITFYLYPKINGINIIEDSEKKLKEKSTNIVLFSVLLFFVWYFSFSSIIGSFYKVFSSIFYGAGESFFQSQATALNTYSPTLYDTIKTIVYTYGTLLIVFLLSFFSLIYIFVLWRRNMPSFRLRYFLVFSGVSFFVFSGLLVAAFFVDFIVGWNRFFVWVLIFSIILITLAINFLLSNSKRGFNHIRSITKFVTIVFVCIFLISLTFLSTFTFYNSPLTGDANLQVTYMDWVGVEWITDNKNKQIVIEELGISHWRFSNAIYGVNESTLMESESISNIIKPIPDHFSYHNKSTLGEYYNESTYMIITRLARIRYPEAYPNYKELWRFTPQDFNQLQGDNSVNRVFDNGDFEAYLIRPNSM